MQGNRSSDTTPELATRRVLHAAGLRFRVNHGIKADDARVIKPDVVFTKRRVALFIDGCFWHGCPEHGRVPASNVAFWTAKIKRNSSRDARDTGRLAEAGWTVVRVWEHESSESVLYKVRQALDSAQAG